MIQPILPLIGLVTASALLAEDYVPGHIDRIGEPLTEARLLFEDNFSGEGDPNAGYEARQSGSMSPAKLKFFGPAEQFYLTHEDGLVMEVKDFKNNETGKTGFLYEHDFGTFRPFMVEAWVDPIEDIGQGQNLDTDLVIGVTNLDNSPNRFISDRHKIVFQIRELQPDLIHWGITLDGQGSGHIEDKVASKVWKGLPDKGRPALLHHDGLIHVRIVAVPFDLGTILRFYIDDLHRPVETHYIDRKIVPNYIGMSARLDKVNGPLSSKLRRIAMYELPYDQAMQQYSSSDYVMENINMDYPGLETVKAAWESGDHAKAKELFIDHMRTRTEPVGPEIEFPEGQNYMEIADHALEGRYGTQAYWAAFNTQFQDDNGHLRWHKGNGHLNRHHHWECLARAYIKTGDERYAKLFSAEVGDWVDKEPHIWYDNPNIGGITSRDGMTHKIGQINGGNVGRRLESPWWHVFEVFRKTESFTDADMFNMLDGVLRNMKIATNPASFLVWDDSGAHIAATVMNTSILFPEAKDAEVWREVAWIKMGQIMNQQYHPDGSHVSLSSGYSWATAYSMLEIMGVLELNGIPMDPKFSEILEQSFTYPIAISRPNSYNIDLNDSSWGKMWDNMLPAVKRFPHREDFKFIATEGREGTKPDFDSIYLPNAGYFIMRTGWGDGDKYLFFDGGPWGASHGKQDGLNIYVDIGGELLLRNSGRGSYAKSAHNSHAGQSPAFNTLMVDTHGQNRIPRWDHEKWLGWNPPERRWYTDEHFDFAESFYDAGWFDLSGEQKPMVKGRHERQVLFVKGDNAREQGYWIIFDNMITEGDAVHTVKFPFHPHTKQADLLEGELGFTSIAGKGAVRVRPVYGEGMEQKIVRGQMEPYMQGWHVVGDNHASADAPVFSWQSQNKSMRAFVIEAALDADSFPVSKIEASQSPEDGAMMFTVQRADGGRDVIVRRSQSEAPLKIGDRDIAGDIYVQSYNAAGEAIALLELSPL